MELPNAAALIAVDAHETEPLDSATRQPGETTADLFRTRDAAQDTSQVRVDRCVRDEPAALKRWPCTAAAMARMSASSSVRSRTRSARSPRSSASSARSSASSSADSRAGRAPLSLFPWQALRQRPEPCRHAMALADVASFLPLLDAIHPEIVTKRPPMFGLEPEVL